MEKQTGGLKTQLNHQDYHRRRRPILHVQFFLQFQSFGGCTGRKASWGGGEAWVGGSRGVDVDGGVGG